MRATRFDQAFSHGLLIIFSFLALYPIVRMLGVALEPRGVLVTGDSLIPAHPSLYNITRVWSEGQFGSAFITSTTISVLVVIISTLCSILAGYAFGTMQFRGARSLFYLLLLGLLIPTEALVIPLYYDLQAVQLAGTIWSVVLPQSATSIAFGTFWMRTFFASVPPELREAALVDGASTSRILWWILVPLGRPAIQVLMVLLFLFSFNDFLLPLVMLSNPSIQTVPLSVATFLGSRTNDVTGLAAAGVLAAIPVMIIYVFTQRKLVEGLLAGAVKG
jgi:raffinose/stachyose/melibiose transport system permease protein